MPEPILIDSSNARYPASLKSHLKHFAPSQISALGSLVALQNKSLAFFTSVKCPGNLILQTYDLAQNLRQAGTTVIGGFHSPMEREALNILLRGTQPIIICPARDIGEQLARNYSLPLNENRALILSPFVRKNMRITAEASVARNRFVAALATYVFVAYAEPRGKMEQLCREVIAWGKPLYTFGDDANANLIALGANQVGPNWVP